MLKALIGEWHWTRPQWLQRTPEIWGLLIGLLALAALVFAYLNLKKDSPRETLFDIQPLAYSQRGVETEPATLRIRLKPAAQNATRREYARLDLVDSVIPNGVRLIPEFSGEWRWNSASELQFMPTEHWPAGRKYRIDIADEIFADDVTAPSDDLEFTTPAFTAAIESFEFHKDPGINGKKQLVAKLSFSHVVSAEAVNAAIDLYIQDPANKRSELNYELQLDASLRQGWLRSDAFELTSEERFANLEIAKSLTPERGASSLVEALKSKTQLPSNQEYFKVTQSNAVIVRDKDDNTAQVLTMRLSDRVAERALAGKAKLYLLPKNPRIGNRSRRNYHWPSASEVTEAHLSASEEVPLVLNPQLDGVADLHSMALDVPENRSLYLRVEAGLASESGFTLARPYSAVLRTPSYPREARIAANGALLPISSSQQLTLIARGVAALKVEIARVDDTQLNHLASQTRGDIRNPSFSNYNFNKDNLSQSSEKIIDVRGKISEALYTYVDLSDFGAEGGFYFISVQGWDRKAGRAIGGRDQRFVLVTDLGLITKANADSSYDVFVHSLASGTPVAGARVELLGKNGIAIASAVSDANGHSTIGRIENLRREKEPTVFVVRNGADTTFLPYGRNSRMLNTSRFDTGGEYIDPVAESATLRAQLLTDRGLYRPGETTRLGIILKRGDWSSLPGVPVRLSVRSPRGQTVLSRDLRLSGDGVAEASYLSDETSATGTYYATLELYDNGRYRQTLGSTTFRLQEFEPDRLSIKTQIADAPRSGWVDPSGLQLQVSLKNLFGTPASDRKLSGTIELVPTNLTFADFPGYTFSDPLRDPTRPAEKVELPLKETRTDDKGEALIDLALENYDQGIYKVRVFTEGFEQGEGRSVKSMASAMMAPLKVLVGYKSPGQLNFVRQGSSLDVEFVALNDSGKAVALSELSAELVEKRKVSTLTQQANGTLAYQSILVDETRSKSRFAITENGTALTLDTEDAGQFELRIFDAKQRIVGRIAYSVAGSGSRNADIAADTELNVLANKQSYRPGETIELDIRAPYAGTGLITIERDKVYSYQWFQTQPGSSVQRIQVPAELEGNAYIGVSLIRSMDSPSIFLSPLSYSIVPFSVDRDARFLTINLDAPEKIEPGDELSIDYSSSQNASLLVYAVDEGILSVAKYEIPRPLDFFLRKIALQVRSFQMVDLLFSDFQQYMRFAAPGGGEAIARIGANLNPFKRQVEKPAVFWSGVVSSGTQKQAVKFRVPDSFNGKLRIMAVGASANRAGHAETATEVRGPFVITPDAPLAVTPGDEFELSVGLANTLPGEARDIRLRLLSSDHMQISTEASASFTLGENQETTHRFRLRANDLLGDATLTLTAESEERSLSRRVSISVRPATARRATLLTGESDSSRKRIDLVRQLYPQFSEQNLLASASHRVLTDGLMDYLKVFAHDCAEQIVSKVFPKIGLLGSKDSEIDQDEIRRDFARTIARIRQRQLSNGGFKFWLSSTEPQRFASVYITHFLIDAKESGLSVPTDMLNNAVSYVREVAGNDTGSVAQARLRAYAIYVLTRSGMVTSTYLTDLADTLDDSDATEWQGDLAAVYMAASYQQLQQGELANRYWGNYELGLDARNTGDFQTRLGHDAQYLYVMAKHFPKQSARLDAATIRQFVEPVMKNRFNTLSAAYTVLALQALDDNPETASTLAAWHTLGANGSSVLSPLQSVSRAAPDSTQDAIELHRQGRAPVYYSVSQIGFDRSPPTDAVAEGLEVTRQLIDDNGNSVSEGMVGDELTVVLRVRSTGEPRSQVALIDLIPGGTSIVMDSVSRASGGWRADYVDVREDRMVVYGNFGRRTTEIRYRLRLTHVGDYALPAASANSMYDQSIVALSKPGRLAIKRQP